MKRLIAFLSILMLMANALLGQEKYDLTRRPDPDGVPTKVYVMLYIIDIQNIDNKLQTFTADFVLRLKWREPRLAGKDTRFNLDEVWHPNVQLYNLRNADAHLGEFVTFFGGDTLRYVQRYHGEFAIFLDFREFPFDRQTLPITLLSFTYGPEEVEFVFEFAGSEKRYSISGWTVTPKDASASTFRADMISGANVELLRSRFDYELEAGRHLNYYWWKVVAPLMVIMFLSWAVFWLDPSQIGPQIGVSATSILTLIAFLLRLENILPPVSYLTHMDHFVFTALSLVFFAYLEALTSTTLALQGRKELALTVDRWSRLAFPAAFIFVMIYFWFI